MSEPAGLHVVLGAAGGIGSSLVRELQARGRPVRAVARSAPDLPPGVEAFAADLSDPVASREACRGAAVVYHCAQPAYPRWAKEFPSLNDSILGGASAAGARLVVADNLYMYGPVEGPLTESSPQTPPSRRGRLRRELAERLLEAHHSGLVEVAIGRAADYFGPRGRNSVVGDLVFIPAVEGHRARWLGRLDRPHTLQYLEDVARGLAMLGERDEAFGGTWHLPAADPVTGREFLELVFEEAGHRPQLGRVAPWMIRVAGLWSPLVRALGETVYQWTGTFVSDWSKFESAFGPSQVTPLREAVARTVVWYRYGSR